MPRTLYEVGAHASVVSDIQHVLAAANFDPRELDGVISVYNTLGMPEFSGTLLTLMR